MQPAKKQDEELEPMVVRPELTEREKLLAALDYAEAHDLMTEEEENGEARVRNLKELRLRAQDEALPIEERKHAILILAHHRSEAAFTELMRFLEKPSAELVGFGWSALDEASCWYLETRMASLMPRRRPGRMRTRKVQCDG